MRTCYPPQNDSSILIKAKSDSKQLRVNNMPERLLTALLLVIVLGGENANAEVVERVGTFGGMRVEYFVVLPDGYDAETEYPAVLIFGGGGQTRDITWRTLENHWVGEAERRGYIVISPAAPRGQLFFETGALIFPSFARRLLLEYNIEGNKFHIAGRSNGGLSAFHIAARHPEYFRSVTGFPGYLNEATAERVDALSGMCIYLHVGEFDPGWARGMERQADVFRSRGLPTRFKVEEGMSHGLDSLAGEGSARLFENLEHATANCG